MAILVLCPNPACGELLSVDPNASTGSVICPACGWAVSVGGQAPAPAPQAPPAQGPPAPIASAALSPAPASPAQPPRPTPIAQPAVPAPPASHAPPSPEPAKPGPTPDDELVLAPLWDEKPPAAPARPVQARNEDELALGPMWSETSSPSAPPKRPGRAAPAPPAAPRPGPAGPTPRPDDLGDSSELLRLFDEPEIQAAPAAQAAAPESTPHDGVLEYQAVPGMVLGMGVVGIVAGAAAGVWLAPHPVWGAYLGGLAGWLGGFLFSLLAAMAHEGENATTRCRACRTPFLIARNECPLCGLPVSGISPMTEGFFQAGRYAAESWGVLGRLALWNSLLGATVAGVYLMRQMEDLQPWPWVLGGLAGYVILAFCIETACEAVQTSAHDIRLPLTPSQTPVLIRLLHALLVIGVLALYTAPLLTVPLLPIALMGVCQPKAGAAFSLRHSLSIAWANRKDFLILWLFLFMWGAVIALLVALCVTTLPYLAPLLNTGLDEASNVTLLAVIAALVGLFAGTVCSVLLLAMCRCIGVFAYFVRPYRRPAESAPSPDGKDDSLSPE